MKKFLLSFVALAVLAGVALPAQAEYHHRHHHHHHHHHQ
jgi:hypothetical protein